MPRVNEHNFSLLFPSHALSLDNDGKTLLAHSRLQIEIKRFLEILFFSAELSLKAKLYRAEFFHFLYMLLITRMFAQKISGKISLSLLSNLSHMVQETLDSYLFFCLPEFLPCSHVALEILFSHCFSLCHGFLIEDENDFPL